MKTYLTDFIGWGVGLWLVGYVLGFIAFMVVPVSLIGWVITPIGVIITLWVLFKGVHSNLLAYYVLLGVVWAALAVVLDYFLLVKLLNPADGYYKLDVYLYYALTLLLPVFVGWYKSRRTQ